VFFEIDEKKNEISGYIKDPAVSVGKRQLPDNIGILLWFKDQFDNAISKFRTNSI